MLPAMCSRSQKARGTESPMQPAPRCMWQGIKPARVLFEQSPITTVMSTYVDEYPYSLPFELIWSKAAVRSSAAGKARCSAGGRLSYV